MPIKLSSTNIILFLTGLCFLLLLSTLSYQIQFWMQHDKWLAIPLYKLVYFFEIDLYFVLNVKPDFLRESIILILELPISVILITLIIIGSCVYFFKRSD